MLKRILLFAAVMGAYTLLALASAAWSQEIVPVDGIDPDQVSISEPVFLRLELEEGMVGAFYAKRSPAYYVRTDTLAPGAAMFFATSPGTFEVVAAINGAEGQPPAFVALELIVKGDAVPPQPDESITKANVQKWLALVPESARSELLDDPLTKKSKTRQQVTAETFRNIGMAGPSLKAIAAIDSMLSLGLPPAWDGAKTDWQPFGDKIDAALAAMVARHCSVEDYSQALILIGEVLAP